MDTDEVELAGVAGAADTNNLVDDNKPTQAFLDAVKELCEEEGHHEALYQDKTVLLVRRIFLGMMVWFALMLAVWDVVIPYAAIKAAFWTGDEQVYCEEPTCEDSCQSLAHLEYNSDCRPEPRIYDDSPLWFNDAFRHEFGHGWTFLISVHIFFAYLLFPSFLTQLFLTIPGHRVHKTLGIIVLVMAVLLWTFGGTAAPILIASRGLHPCAYVIKGYNNPGTYSKAMNSTFSIGLYLQFMYDGPLLNECLVIGIAARLLLAMAFDPGYPYVSRRDTFLRLSI